MEVTQVHCAAVETCFEVEYYNCTTTINIVLLIQYVSENVNENDLNLFFIISTFVLDWSKVSVETNTAS